ncbi:MAG: LysM peptidoglycan-binding domain-containing protein [Arthrobacter sp.]|nr:LysM peptidoglycan-binding domain-containing protein [Arthrobacter sp.]
MPLTPPRRRSPLHGAIVTATLPVITLAGISVAAAPAQAAPGPAGMAPSAKNIAASKARITASLQASAAKKSSSDTVTVKRGDSLWAIATRNRVPLAQLLKLNGLKASAIIHPGDRLVLRASASSSTSTKAATSTSKVSASSASSATHTIKAGDTLSGIAHRYGLSLSSLLKLNSLKASTVIYPGQKIKLKATTPAATSTSTSTKKPSVSTSSSSSTVKTAATHTIKAGDTLSGIAAKYGVSLNELLAANGLSRSSIIYVGRTLKLPASASSSGTSTSTSTGSIPKTFLQYTYSDATNRSANANQAILNARTVPSRAQMRQIVIAEAKKQGVDPALAAAHASVESGFNARAVSPANALGVMQMLPSTGEWMSQRLGRKLDLLDPYDNVAAGVAYIAYLQSIARTFDEGIGSYYAGPSGVIKRGLKNDVLDYVNKVKAAMRA